MKEHGRRKPIKNPGKIHGSDCGTCCPTDNKKSRERRESKQAIEKDKEELPQILKSEED